MRPISSRASSSAVSGSTLYGTCAGVFPVLAPLAVAVLEPRRLPITLALVGLGVAVAGVLSAAVVRGPIASRIDGYHLAYDTDLPIGGHLVAAYVAVTCGSLLLSSHRHVRRFGVANFVVVALLAWLDQSAFISLWCAWAALTSIGICLHLRRRPPTDLDAPLPAARGSANLQ
ncbi:MAG: DUF6629 family protein [Acidimicrobiales bacterium]